jgi:hypothetical protein
MPAAFAPGNPSLALSLGLAPDDGTSRWQRRQRVSDRRRHGAIGAARQARQLGARVRIAASKVALAPGPRAKGEMIGTSTPAAAKESLP